MSRSTRPLLIVVGGTDLAYRGYCVERVAAAYPIALIDTKPPSEQQHLVVDHEVAATHDPAAVVAAGLALAARHPVAGVVTWDEYALVPAAELAARLGVPGNSAAAMTACRDKATSRRLFAEHDVPSATSTRVDTLAQATAAAFRTGFPVVLKPSSHAASIGVVRADTPEELPSAWRFASAGAGEQGPEGSGVLVEEYLFGPEISVECVTQHGVTTALAVTRKEVAFPPYFEEVGHTVDAGDPLLPEVAPVAVQAVRALGVTCGIQHVEMRLTPSGPRIIEVNSRIGGDLIGELVRLATGLDLPRIAADVACGTVPDLTPTTHASAAIKILYPPATGTLSARNLSITPGPEYPWLHPVTWLREVGEPVALPPAGDLDAGRVGFLVVTADSPEAARDRLTFLTTGLTLSVAP
ncbi:ATP-grasp domain-containing protein [Streptomyces sp. NBC_00257]|uniref:ATP-grasp domain-containing protein n=1 Tax=unclassified Streptomyces TaxID=2593676 RepID=UPI0022556583|nr:MULTISPECIES: ATP-grasp domain-containing protein [unclassified Streptomyces]MCX4870849.1 ATP-grasp domain-containing protein [Streptomyces sp. NBC_00906]MCX4901589.1 ATP-grasp domain-containing protein [Streptomyces sp. NBC_00892]MCX5426832.1 ATP-grasp domain-containing protein [Streptomyces sp. NBC_00062]